MSKVKNRFDQGLNLIPENGSSFLTNDGDIGVDSSVDKLKVHLDGVVESVVTENQTQDLENKTIDADLNIIENLETDNLKAGVLNTSSSLAGATDAQIPSALAVKNYADSGDAALQDDVDDLVTLSGVPVNSVDLGTFTGTIIPANQNNKQAIQSLADHAATTDVVVNTIGNATNALIALSGVPSGSTDLGTFTGTTIPDGATDKSALQALETSLESTQSTVSNKVTGPASATDNALVRYDGTTGKLVKDSVVSLSDTGVVTGLTGLVSSGDMVSTGSFSATGEIAEAVSTNSTSTGSNVDLPSPSSPFIRLSNASLSSISTILSPSQGRVLTIENATGNSITINNDSGSTAANRILTGTKAPITLADEASLVLKYDSVETRWMVIGGTGSGSGSSLDTIFQLTGTDFAQWSSGNNATFLGGGTLAGTFVSNTSTPMNGTSSYLYTQAAGSLNDYIASPAQAVSPKFRGQTVTFYHPYSLSTGSLELRVYDVTNATLIPLSATVPTSTNISTYRTNFTIPSTCTSIRIGYQVASLSSGSVFSFDDIQVTSDTTIMAPIANQFQSSFLRTTATITANTNIIGALNSSTGSGNYSYNAATGVYTVLKSGTQINISAAVNVGAGAIFAIININGVEVIRGSVDGRSASTSWSGILNSGETFSAYSGNSSSTISSVAVSSSSINTNILTPTQVFNSDVIPFVFANAATYTLATLSNAPIGTYITWTYGANNTRTQTTGVNRPTQTDADMNINGIQMYKKASNASSTAAQPAALAIQIGKGMKGVSLGLYKSTGKTTAGSLDTVFSGTQNYGFSIKEYNEVTGILVLDAAYDPTSSGTSPNFTFSDASQQTNGYVTINASTNPALTGLNIQTYYLEGQGNAGQVITANTTNIPFIATSDLLGEWSGSVFTAANPGTYVFTVGVLYTAGVSTGLGFLRGGNTYRFTTPASAASFHAGTFTVKLIKGETISIRSVDAGGTLSNAISHRLTVVKTNVG